MFKTIRKFDIVSDFVLRISDFQPLPYRQGAGLGPPNPGTIVVARETLGIRWTGFSPVIFVTHPNIRTSQRSTKPHGLTSAHCERSPTTCTLRCKSMASVACLAPLNLPRGKP